jgi:hypothetical protein
MGPQGPAGASSAFKRIIPVAINPSDPNTSGTALLDAISNFYWTYGDSAPVVFQLDAGTYLIPSPIILSPNVSLQGAGIFSTTIIYDCVACTDSPAISLPGGSPNNAISSQSISGLTIETGLGTSAFAAHVSSTLLIDHVQILSTARPTARGLAPSQLTLVSEDARFLITNSLLGPVLQFASTATPHIPSAILSSEIDPAFAPQPENTTPALLVCSGAYNAAGKTLSSACK